MLQPPFNGQFKISQLFGENLNTFYKSSGKKGHGGIDFAMPNGTPLYAVCDGEIIFTTDPTNSARTGWGISILSDEIFKHEGKDCQLSCLYAHLKEGSLKVKRGDRVKKGDLIALSNNSGQSTGPHLHFAVAPLEVGLRKELCKDNGYGGYVDPMPYLDLPERRIKELQALLNKHGAKLAVDGKWGKLSETALKKFLGNA